MIGLEDRQSLSQDIDAAYATGARLHLACEIAGIDVRTLQRWKAHKGLVAGDGRPQAVRAATCACPEPGRARRAAARGQRAALCGRAAGAHRAHAGRRGRVPGQRVQHGPRAARARAEQPPGTRQEAACRAPAHHPRGHRATPGVVLGHDLPACGRDRRMVPPVPDPGPVQPQDHRLGSARHG